jgi:hypothetical protein
MANLRLYTTVISTYVKGIGVYNIRTKDILWSVYGNGEHSLLLR